MFGQFVQISALRRFAVPYRHPMRIRIAPTGTVGHQKVYRKGYQTRLDGPFAGIYGNLGRAQAIHNLDASAEPKVAWVAYRFELPTPGAFPTRLL
jgi:hypothetical protein